jgi:TatD DNase family protein
MLRAIDVHCHISAAERIPIGQIWTMATDKSNWKAMLMLQQRYPEQVKAGVGIHPWWTPVSLESELREFSLSESCFSGEFGLDSVFRHQDVPYPLELQMPFFVQQYRQAVALKKPMSIHIVKAWEPFVEFVSQEPNDTVPVMLHSFSGTADLIQRLSQISVPIYFSFSATINARQGHVSKRLKNNIKSVPKDRLLIESDVDTIDKVLPAMESIVQIVSDIRGWSIEETIETTRQNSLRILDLF